MIELVPPQRLANVADAAALADLVNYAGEGLPFYVWKGLATQNQDPWEIGRARQAKKALEGSVVVVDLGTGAVAGLTGYRIGSKPVQIDEDFPALLRPLQELENLAPNSWYVNVLACYPEHRNQGLGSSLLDLADKIARSEGLSRLSVIVASNNVGAQRLYQRKGFRESARAPCLKENWETDAEDWLLLIKTL